MYVSLQLNWAQVTGPLWSCRLDKNKSLETTRTGKFSNSQSSIDKKFSKLFSPLKEMKFTNNSVRQD